MAIEVAEARAEPLELYMAQVSPLVHVALTRAWSDGDPEISSTRPGLRVLDRDMVGAETAVPKDA